ncbi:MAG TPA: SDR family oxidoreductase [Acidimicrobiales bacterium]|nr:SDR family oxidoreductase [Acidimicrobiales bacterium]
MPERRVALVTGGNHGIGAATAAALQRGGFAVAVTYLRFEAPERDLPPEYHEARRNAPSVYDLKVEADLRDPATPAAVFDMVETALGPVSVLVNNASGWRKDSFAAGDVSVTAESVDAQFLVDARGGALCIAELARRHRERHDDWGRIISLTSGGPMGFPGEASYGAAKAALENYTMTASRELGRQGITANVVYPPVTDTGWVTDDVRRFVEQSDEHWHVAPPEDVAEVIAWLCTPAADLVNGSIIRLR